MEEKFLCVMAGYDDATEDYFSMIQNNLYEKGFTGRHTKKLPQHITLGTFPVEMEQEITEKVKQVAGSANEFDITFNHAGIFQGSEVLFIAPDANMPLLELKEHFNDNINWTAHTTMLIDEPGRIIEAMPLVLEQFNSYMGKVTTLHLYEFFQTRHILTVNLKEEHNG